MASPEGPLIRPTLVALFTCHDRRALTIRALHSLQTALSGRDDWLVVLADDGSRDGTAAAARATLGDRVVVLRGDGHWFWNQGMRRAWQWAARHHPQAAVLWCNDDIVLDADAISRLEEASRSSSLPTVAVGALRDPVTGTYTYGGWNRLGWWRPLAFVPLGIAARDQPCDTCNGNLVLVPAAITREIGLLHPAYHHGLGDFDFGLQVRRRGLGLVQVAGSCGTCARNPAADSWGDRSLPPRRRWRLLLAPKGLPPRGWFTWAWRCAGPLGLLAATVPYLRVLIGR